MVPRRGTWPGRLTGSQMLAGWVPNKWRKALPLAGGFVILVALPLTKWMVLGEVMQISPGQFQFTDPQPATNATRLYHVSSP